MPSTESHRSTAAHASHGGAAPAVGGAPAATGKRRDAWLLSGDDGLLLELGPLLGERYRTRPIDSPDALKDAGTAPWLLVFDATTRREARAVVASIDQQHPLAPIILVCADGQSASWASALQRGSVCAIVERSQLSATTWRDALRAAEQRLDTAATLSTSSSLTSLASTGNPFSSGRRLWRVLLPLLLLAGTALGYFLFRHAPLATIATATVAPAPLAVAADRPTAQGTAAPGALAAPEHALRTPLELLSDARVAFRDEKALLPHSDGVPGGESALELYAQVLAQEPQNEEARDGMRRLFTVARARIQSDLNAGKLDDATRLLNSFRGVGLDAGATSKLEADIAAARPRWLIAQTRTALANNELDTAAQLIAQIAAGGADRLALADLRRSLEAHTGELQLAEMAARTRAAIAAGTLLEPAAESARARLQTMQQANRGHPLTLGVQHELQVALLARAQAALRNQQPDAAQPWLNAAAELGASGELTAVRKQLQGELDAGSQRAAAAAAAAQLASEPADTAVAQPAVINARPVRALDAVYPPKALKLGQQGRVVVEFTLDRKGRASEPRVVEASLPGVFDAAALQAVRGGRYDTAALGSSGLPRRARLLVSFKPT
ncbi:MAG: energy transducer TonB [Steroidobacteraceae bacterium]